MSIIDKCIELLNKIAENDTLTLEDKMEIHEFVLERFQKYAEYIEATNAHTFVIQSINALRRNGVISQEQYEARLKEVDMTRRMKHNAAIDASNQLNRLCAQYGVSPICDVDTSVRKEVALFAGRYALETHNYALGHNYTPEEIIAALKQ